jgi:hypothetical protein
MKRTDYKSVADRVELSLGALHSLERGETTAALAERFGMETMGELRSFIEGGQASKGLADWLRLDTIGTATEVLRILPSPEERIAFLLGVLFWKQKPPRSPTGLR